MLLWVGILFNVILLAALIWIWVVIIKLFLNKEYRDCPPYVPSFGAEKKIIIERVSQQLQNSKQPLTVLDPGCGTGTLLTELAHQFPQHRFIGIEWGKLAWLIARFKSRKLKNITILQQDMFSYSFKSADIIVCFLMQPLMARFGDKVKTDAKPGLTIYSNSFYIPNIELGEKIETKRFLFVKNVYVYKLP